MCCAFYCEIYEVINTSQNTYSANYHDESIRPQRTIGKKGKKEQFSRIDHTGINQARMVMGPAVTIKGRCRPMQTPDGDPALKMRGVPWGWGGME